MKKMALHRQTHLKDFKQRVLGLRKEQKISVLGVSREERGGELCGGYWGISDLVYNLDLNTGYDYFIAPPAASFSLTSTLDSSLV